MRTWWDAREPRERVLLGVLGALFGLFVAVFAVVLPVVDAQSRAEAALLRAQADARIVARINAPAPGAARTAFDRTALLSAAREQGLQITRIDTQGDAALVVWIDDAQTAPLYALFEQLLTGTTAQLERVAINADATGRLRAQFTLRPG